MKRLLIMFAGLVWATTAQAASFDCAKAGTKVEKLICADATLSKLDDELNAVYKAALQDKKQAVTVKQAQKQWIKERNDCGESVCVKRVYDERIYELNQTVQELVGNGIQDNDGDNRTYSTVTYSLAMSKNVKLCNHMNKAINRDVIKHSEFKLANHTELNTINWKVITNGKLDILGQPDFQYQLAKFDINNDDKNEWVIKFRGGLKGYASDVLYIFNEKSKLQHPQQDLRFMSIERDDEISFTGGFYELKDFAEKTVDGDWYSIGGMVTLDPFQFDGVFYLSMDSQIPSDGEYSKAESRWVVISKYLKKGKLEDVCYFKRVLTK